MHGAMEVPAQGIVKPLDVLGAAFGAEKAGRARMSGAERPFAHARSFSEQETPRLRLERRRGVFTKRGSSPGGRLLRAAAQ